MNKKNLHRHCLTVFVNVCCGSVRVETFLELSKVVKESQSGLVHVFLQVHQVGVALLQLVLQ